MDVIITNSERKDIGQIEQYANIDIDCAKKKTITVQIARSYYDPEFTFDSWVYIPGTEYAGRIDKVSTTSALDYVELKADTCRGKLEKKAIVPPAGQTHLVMSGDIHDIMRNLIDNQFDGYITVVTYKANVSLTDYRFDRYDNLLNGINKMLKSASYKLVTRAVRTNNSLIHFEVLAEPITDYSNLVEVSGDIGTFNFTMEDGKDGYNHIIGLGKGEGLDRAVVHKYIGADGSVTDTKFYTGFDENVYIYENTSAEAADLAKKTVEKLVSVASKKKFGMSAISIEDFVKIGDIVGGKDEITGLYNAKPIENIICKIRNGVPTLTYKLEGES